MTEPFNGAKLAILNGSQVVTILRDDFPTIPWPGYWDFPGGGREGNEDPAACVLRELKEELGLILAPESLTWSTVDRSVDDVVWFFAAEWPDFDPGLVRFGNEGQMWRLAEIDWFLEQEKAIPSLKTRLKRCLSQR